MIFYRLGVALAISLLTLTGAIAVAEPSNRPTDPGAGWWYIEPTPTDPARLGYGVYGTDSGIPLYLSCIPSRQMIAAEPADGKLELNNIKIRRWILQSRSRKIEKEEPGGKTIRSFLIPLNATIWAEFRATYLLSLTANNGQYTAYLDAKTDSDRHHIKQFFEACR